MIHFGCEQYLNLISIALWINTHIMVADIFTKPLERQPSGSSAPFC